MTSFREVLRISLRHGFYDPAEPPIDVVAVDHSELRDNGLLIRKIGSETVVVTNQDTLPDTLSVAFVPHSHDVFGVTVGADGNETPILSAGHGTDAVTLTEQTAKQKIEGHPRRFLSVLTVALSQTPRQIDVSFDAPRLPWTYVFVGPESERVAVRDTSGNVAFRPEGSRVLPDGRTAYAHRSTSPLQLQARSTHHFALTSPGPTGRKTIIPRLPVAGAEANARDGGRETEIFVSLF